MADDSAIEPGDVEAWQAYVDDPHSSGPGSPKRPDPFLILGVALGIVILIGIVVNNAILIVHQAINFMHGAEGDPMPGREAIRESVRSRVRPIFMSTLTSLFGMLPLLVVPGAGSEI